MRCPECMGFSKTIGHELVCAAARQAEISAAPDDEPDPDAHAGSYGEYLHHARTARRALQILNGEEG